MVAPPLQPRRNYRVIRATAYGTGDTLNSPDPAPRRRGGRGFHVFGKDEVTVDADLVNYPTTLDQLDVGCGLFYYQVPRTESAW